MRIFLFLLPLVIGKDVRQRRNAGAAIAGEVAGEVAADVAGTVLNPITQVVDSFSNFGSMINSCVQTGYMVKEYELNKRQLAISEEELKINRLQAKIAQNALDWDKEKFRIEQILNEQDTKAAAKLQKELNANMVNVMRDMANILQNLVDTQKHQHLWPMYDEILTKTHWFMETIPETDDEIKRRNQIESITRRQLKREITDDDFDFKTFHLVVNHVVQKMTRECDYEAISFLTVQINAMFNLLHSTFKNDEVLLNARRTDFDYLEARQRYFLDKSIMFHLRKNWLMNEPVINGSKLCFEPYYKNSTTGNVCYDYDDKWKLPSVNDGDLGNDCFAKCGNKTGECSACGYVGHCCSKTNFDPNNQKTDPSRCPSSAILAASRKSGMNSDEHTCVFKERPEKIYVFKNIVGKSAEGFEMSYVGDFINLPIYEALADGDSGHEEIILYNDGSWQICSKMMPNCTSLEIASSDVLDIQVYGYDDEDMELNVFDNFEEYERLLNSPYWLDIDVVASNGKQNNFLSGIYKYHKMLNNAQSFIINNRFQSTESDDINVFLWYTGDSWVFTDGEMFGQTNPINWLKLESPEKSIKYLKTDWLENSGDFSDVMIDFWRDEIVDKIFLDIPAVSWYNNETDHGDYGGEYLNSGRLNNKPYFKRWIDDKEDNKVLMFKDSSWFLCEEIDDGPYDELGGFLIPPKMLGEFVIPPKMCQMELKHKKYEETYEIKTDKDFNNLFDGNEWFMFSTAGYYVDEMTSHIDEKPVGFGQERIRIKVRSTNDYYWWRGDDVKIVQQNKFGEFIASNIILKAGETEQSTFFDVSPDDQFLIKNGGNNGVYIKELRFGDKVIKVNGQSSFWIDGNSNECDASKVPEVSEFTVVNGEVTDGPCNE